VLFFWRHYIQKDETLYYIFDVIEKNMYSLLYISCIIKKYKNLYYIVGVIEKDIYNFFFEGKKISIVCYNMKIKIIFYKNYIPL